MPQPKVSVEESFFDIQITFDPTHEIQVGQMVQALLRVLPVLVARWVKRAQEVWLRQELGPVGQSGNRFGPFGPNCPDCSSRSAKRHGWPSRNYYPEEIDSIEIPKRTVKCRDCGRSYWPYGSRLGIKKHQQFDDGLIIEGLRRVMEMSFAKASESLGEDGPSAATLWRRLQDTEPETNEADEQSLETVLVDATDVPKWKASGQVTLTISQQISRDDPRYGRARLDRSVVGVTAGNEEDIKPVLEDQSIDRLLHDGKLDLSAVCETEGRCRWHVPYTVKHLLYRDDIYGDQNKKLHGELKQAVFDGEETADVESDINDWIENHQDEAPESVGHVENALAGMMNVLREDFSVQTTAPVEREMVELNKRFENGGGWTQSGAETMLKHRQLWRHNREEWERQVNKNGGSQVPQIKPNSGP